jgi:hypothetical protein
VIAMANPRVDQLFRLTTAIAGVRVLVTESY